MQYDISNQAKLPTRFGDFFTMSFREYLADSTTREHLVVFTQHKG